MVKQFDLYQLLKNSGMKLEWKVNETIQNQLNRKEAALLFNTQSQIAANVINKLQQKIEILSIPLNFPTKQDMANATKINVQTEEKVDLLDDKVSDVLTSLNELKQLVTKGANRND